jgi:hypothetical protein
MVPRPGARRSTVGETGSYPTGLQRLEASRAGILATWEE